VSSVYLGIDYGAKRVGLSHADGLGFAFPLPAAVAPEAEERFAQIGREIARLRVTQLVLGYPLSVEGDRTKRCDEVDAFAAELTRRSRVDESSDSGITCSQSRDVRYCSC
jgi:putative Holliday junction resolvase